MSSDRRAEFQAKLGELIEEYWEAIGPSWWLDPEDEYGIEEMTEGSQAVAWILLGEARSSMAAEDEMSWLFGVPSPMLTPFHAQGIVAEYTKY